MVNSVTLFPNSSIIGSASSDHTIRIWDVVNGADLLTIKGHLEDVLCLAYSPDATVVASGWMNGAIRLWDACRGACLKTLEVKHGGWVCSVTFSQDGALIVSGSIDTSVRIWDVASGRNLRTLQDHSTRVTSVTFTPNSNQIISVSDDGDAYVNDVTTGSMVSALKQQSGIPLLSAFLNNQRDAISDKRLWANVTSILAVYFNRGNLAYFSPADQNEQRYFIEDGWVYLDSPRKHLCWIHGPCRGIFISAKNRIVFGAEDGRVTFIDLSKIV